LEVLVAPPRKNPFFIQKDGQIDTVIMPVDQFKALKAAQNSTNLRRHRACGGKI